MSEKKKVIKQNADKRLLRVNLILKSIILLMAVLVIYDAIVYKTPFYYIGFYFAGYVVGKLYTKTLHIDYNTERESLTLSNNWFNVAVTLFFVLVRFYLGKLVLQSFHVIFISDAIYLFFIGLYYSKWRVVLNKIDTVIYNYANKKYNKEK